MTRRVVAAFLLLLAVLLVLARIAPPTRSDEPVTATAVPAGEFKSVQSWDANTKADPKVTQVLPMSPSPTPMASQPVTGNSPAPSLRPRVAAERVQPVGVKDARAGSTPATGSTAPSVTGLASWFAYTEGGAAAGPALRSALGAGWRGQSVAVCRTDGGAMACVHVVLSGWCACGDRNGVPTVIDLDAASFAELMPLSRGLVTVEVLTP